MCVCFFFKQKTAYEMRISGWSSDVCSSDRLGRGLSLVDRTAGRFLPLVDHLHADIAAQIAHVDRALCIEREHFLLDHPRLVEGVVVDEGGPEIGRASCRERVCKYV